MNELVKSQKQATDSPYGYCPHCGAKGISRERRVDGYDCCEKGCRYPSTEAVQSLEDYVNYINKLWEPHRAKEKFVVGPCAAFTVPCICVDYRRLPEGKASDNWLLENLAQKYMTNGHCDLCCGCGWLTKKVKDLIYELEHKIG